MKSLTNEQETTPALSAGEALQIEIRRGEKLLGWFSQTRQNTMVEMLARDLRRARAALAGGEAAPMARAVDILRHYEP